MSETAATRLTALCTALATVGALVGLLVNSGEPTDAAVMSVPVSVQVSAGGPSPAVHVLR